MSDCNFKISPLSDAFARLLTLTEEQSQDLGLLELLVQKDPGALARILNLANSAYFVSRSTAPVSTVRDALRRLGAATVVDALYHLWGYEVWDLEPRWEQAGTWLSRHTFSLLATLRKTSKVSKMLNCGPLELHLVALVDKLSLATLLAPGPQTPEVVSARSALLEGISADRHCLHQQPELRQVFGRSLLIAEHWKMPEKVRGLLAELARWTPQQQDISPPVQVILLAELSMQLRIAQANSREGAEAEELLDALYESSPVIQRLVANRVAVEQLAVLF